MGKKKKGGFVGGGHVPSSKRGAAAAASGGGHVPPSKGGAAAAALGEGMPGRDVSSAADIEDALFNAAIAKASTAPEKEYLRDIRLRAPSPEGRGPIEHGAWSMAGLIAASVTQEMVDGMFALDLGEYVGTKLQEKEPLGFWSHVRKEREASKYRLHHPTEWCEMVLEHLDVRLNASVAAYLNTCGRNPPLFQEDPTDILTPVLTMFKRNPGGTFNKAMWTLAVALLVVFVQGRVMTAGKELTALERKAFDLRTKSDAFRGSDSWGLLQGLVYSHEASIAEKEVEIAVDEQLLKVVKASHVIIEKRLEQRRLTVASAKEQEAMNVTFRDVEEKRMKVSVDSVTDHLNYLRNRLKVHRENLKRDQQSLEDAKEVARAAGAAATPRRWSMTDRETGDVWVEAGAASSSSSSSSSSPSPAPMSGRKPMSRMQEWGLTDVDRDIDQIFKYDEKTGIPEGVLTVELGRAALKYLRENDVFKKVLGTVENQSAMQEWHDLIGPTHGVALDNQHDMVIGIITKIKEALRKYADERNCEVDEKYVTQFIQKGHNHLLMAVQLKAWCEYNLGEIQRIVSERDRGSDAEAGVRVASQTLYELVSKAFHGDRTNERIMEPDWFERNVKAIMHDLDSNAGAAYYVKAARDVVLNESLRVQASQSFLDDERAGQEYDLLRDLYKRSLLWSGSFVADEAPHWEDLCRILDPGTSATRDAVVKSMAGEAGLGGYNDYSSEDEEGSPSSGRGELSPGRGISNAGDPEGLFMGMAAGPARRDPASDEDSASDEKGPLNDLVEEHQVYSFGMDGMPDETRLKRIEDIHKRLEKYHEDLIKHTKELAKHNKLLDAHNKYERGEGHLVEFEDGDGTQPSAYVKGELPNAPTPDEKTILLEEWREHWINHFDGTGMRGRGKHALVGGLAWPPWTEAAIGSLGVKEGPLFKIPEEVLAALRSRGHEFKYLKEVEDVVEAPPGVSVVGWAGIEGLDLVKEKLAVNLIIPQNNPELYTGVLTVNRNFLFWGPPGTGKTVIARRAAQLSGAVFVNITGAWILRGFQNDAAPRINALYAVLRKLNRPVVVFVDEAEGVIATRGRNDHLDATVTAFLVNLEQTEHPEPVFTIFATNYPANVDGAILSRIGVIVPLWLPSRDVRYKRFEVELTKGKNQGLVEEDVLDPDFLSKCVVETLWWSNRDITNCVRELYSGIAVRYLEKQVDMATTDLRKLKIRPEDLPKLTRENVLSGLATQPNSRAQAEEAYTWAKKTGTPVDEYVPVEYRRALSVVRTKTGFAAFLV